MSARVMVRYLNENSLLWMNFRARLRKEEKIEVEQLKERALQDPCVIDRCHRMMRELRTAT